MNLRKSLLSLAAIMALGNTAIADGAATYMPLASKTADSVWTLFGVNGFSDGTPSNALSVSSGFSAGLSSLTDTVVSDDLATSGLSGWASLQALKDSPVTITSLSAGIAVSGSPDVLEPIRSMYVKVASSAIAQPNVKLNYRASLEGQSVEFLLNGNLYTSTISQNATWANPAVAVSGATTTTTTKRTAIVDVLDFDFSDNPVDPKNFDYTKDLNTTGTAASFFYFNALTQQWEVNQKGAPAQAQDFTTFNAGKAYWGRADRNESLGSQVINAGGSIGLVLGAAVQVNNLPDPNRYRNDANVSTLTTGWNMLSFDDSKPFIRHSATGLVLTGLANLDHLRITDDSGLNSITLPALTAAATQADAIKMNATMESAKLRGLVPESFNVKVFFSGTAGTLIILSDKKFKVENLVNGAVGVKTLNNQNPYLASTNLPGAVTDLRDSANPIATAGDNVAVSAYGEYTLMMNVLTGASTADTLGTANGGFAKIIYSDADGATADANRLITVNGTSTLAQAKTQIQLMGLTTHPVATPIDSNFDGTADMLIVTSSKPFSVEDATYIRAFDYTADATGGDIAIDAGTGATKTVAGAATTATVAGQIDTAVTNLHAAKDSGAAKILVAYTGSSTFDVKDIASGTIGVLKQTRTATDAVMKGAVSGVYALDTIARLPLNQVTVTSAGGFGADANATPIMMDAVDTYAVTGTYADGTSMTAVPPTAAGANVNSWGAYKNLMDAIVKAMNASFKTDGKHAYASHNLDLAVEGKATTDPLTNTVYAHKITAKGVDIASFTIALADVGPAGVDPAAISTIDANGTITGDNKIAIGSGDITTDLRTNPAYTPNYATYGPLYTLRLKATTEMNATTGAINWDSIDLTRTEDQWFKNKMSLIYLI